MAFLKGAYFHTPILSLFFLAQGVPLSVIVASNIFWSIGAFVGEVPTGMFADRYGQKIALTLGYLTEALGILCVLLFPSTATLIIYFTISGIGFSFLSGSEEALLFESTKKDSTQNYQREFGRFLSNEMIGFMAATALAGFAYARFGAVVFDLLLLLTALCFFACAFLSRFLADDRGTQVTDDKGSNMFDLVRESFGLIRSNKTVWALTLVTVLTISGEYLIQNGYQPFFESNQVPAYWLGLVLTLGTAANILATRVVHKLEDVLVLEKILVLLNLPLGLLFLAMGVFTHPVFLVGAYIVMGGLFNLQRPVISDYINTRSSAHIRTTVLSGISFVKRIVGIVLGLVFAVVVDRFGIQSGLILQGAYLVTGVIVSYLTLLSCGCTHKIRSSDYSIT